MEAHLVGLRGVPGEVEAGGALLARAHAVLPAEARDEVAAGVADGGDAHLLHELDDVLAEALVVGGRVAGLVDAVVHVAAEVLDEAAEDVAVDRAYGEGGVEGEACVLHQTTFSAW